MLSFLQKWIQKLSALAGFLRSVGRQTISFLSPVRQKLNRVLRHGLQRAAVLFQRFGASVHQWFLKTRINSIQKKFFRPGLRRRFLGATVVAFAVCMTIVFTSFYHIQYAIAVEKNGEVVAYIKDEQTYQEAQNMLAQQLIDVPMERAEITSLPKRQATHELKVTSVPDNMPLEDEAQLAETLLEAADQDITSATGLYVDGVFYGAVADADILEQTLAQMEENYAVQQGVPTEAVSVKNDVEFRDGLYLTNCIQEGDQLVSLMQSEVQTEEYYTIQEGDTLLSVSAQTGVDYDLLTSLNPGLDEVSLQIGQQLLTSQSKPLISLSAVKQVESEQEVPYSQERRENSNLEKGTTNVLQTGENGLIQVCEQIEIVDGQQTSSTVLSQETIKNAVPEIIEVGVKEGGDLIRPLNTGYVSQGYSSSHQAVDIAAPTGTAVHAAAGGTVTYASWYSTYGNCVIIDHGNGKQTLYAHLSEIDVKVGQKVSQGSTIGLVGSTGNSTGPHLHFEVRVGGQKVNPFSYCKI